MQNPNSVMTQAFDGNVGEVAIELGITDKRIYELLAKDNPYPKLWRMLNPLGRIAPLRLQIVRADFNARCARILDKQLPGSTPASMHKELSDAINSVLAKAPKAEQKKEIYEAIAELYQRLAMIETEE